MTNKHTSILCDRNFFPMAKIFRNVYKYIYIYLNKNIYEEKEKIFQNEYYMVVIEIHVYEN